MMLKIDLHVHTKYSPDCRVSLKKILMICQKRGLNGIGVTDHNTIEGALRLKEIAPDGFFVIVGEEINTTKGEITGLFVKRQISDGLSPEETIEKIREQGGLVYIPHPFARFRKSTIKVDRLEKIWREVDIIEVFNSRNIFSKDNEKALQFAKSKGLLYGVGSDAHTGYEVGNAYVEMNNFNSEQEFLESLKMGKLHTKKSPILVHGITKILKIVKKIKQ